MNPGEGTTLSEGLIRLEGKLDAYAAGQSATLVEHARRLDGHDRAIDELRTAPSQSGGSARISPWVIAGIVISGVVGLSSILGVFITLIRVIPEMP